jgi:hypothetical protein
MPRYFGRFSDSPDGGASLADDLPEAMRLLAAAMGESRSATLFAGHPADGAPVVARLDLDGLPDRDRAAEALDDNVRTAATAVLDSTPDPADWQAPWLRQLSQALAGEPTHMHIGAREATCTDCDGGPWKIDGSDPDVDSTWQQWECPACGSWHDRAEEVTPEPVTQNTAAVRAALAGHSEVRRYTVDSELHAVELLAADLIAWANEHGRDPSLIWANAAEIVASS